MKCHIGDAMDAASEPFHKNYLVLACVVQVPQVDVSGVRAVGHSVGKGGVPFDTCDSAVERARSLVKIPARKLAEEALA